MTMSRGARWRARLYLFAKGAMLRMTIGARCVLVDGDRVLLIRHTYVPGWTFPGGGVDPGETIEQAARREVLEETGYRLGGSLELFGMYHNTEATNRDHVALFVARVFEQERAFRPGIEIAEQAWFDRNELPADTSPGARMRLAEIFEGATPHPEWSNLG